MADLTRDARSLSEYAHRNNVRLLAVTGGSGAGKTTFCRYLEAEGWQVCSPGQAVRSSGVVTDGELAPPTTEDIVRRFVMSAIDSAVMGNSVAIDGFPRSAEQAKWLLRQCYPGTACLVVVSASTDVREARVLARMDDYDARVGFRRLQFEANNLGPTLTAIRSEFSVHRTWEIINE